MGAIEFDAEENDSDIWDRPVKIGEVFYAPDSCKLPRGLRVPARRPRSARYLGTVSWSWSPAHERSDNLYLSLDTSRKYYLLWLEWTGEDPMQLNTAFARATGKATVALAMELVAASYIGEERQMGEGKAEWDEVFSGMLSEQDFETIAKRVWPEAPNLTETQEVVSVAAALKLGSVIDDLTIAEMVLRRECAVAAGGFAVNIAGVFLKAANSIEHLVMFLTARAVTSPSAIPTAIRDLTRDMQLVESRLAHVPGRFDLFWNALRKLVAAIEAHK